MDLVDAALPDQGPFPDLPDIYRWPDRTLGSIEIVSMDGWQNADQSRVLMDVAPDGGDTALVHEEVLFDGFPLQDVGFDLPSLAEDLPLVSGDWQGEVPDALPWSCPYGAGYCVGLTWYWCDDSTQTEHETDCTNTGIPCKSATCTDGIGCQFLPDNQLSCSDGNKCTAGDHCAGGVCIGGESLDCNDGNPCTADSCSPGSGSCQHLPTTAPCDDDDGCTTNDTCLAGECVGEAVACPLGATCSDGTCSAEPTYPPPPYGTHLGDTVPNQTFLDPDLAPHSLAEFWGSGAALLVTFNAGWCKVCKEDTVVLNSWVKDYGPDGLAILSILYETPNGEPITQGFAQWWDSFYQLTFPLWLDTPVADANGDATGGGLAAFRQPSGPVEPGYFPVTLIVCPATMEILYVSKGFYDDVVTEAVEHWLYVEDCATGLAY